MDDNNYNNNTMTSNNIISDETIIKVTRDLEQQNKNIEYSLDPFERLKQLQEFEQRARVIKATQAYKSLQVYIAESDKNWKLKAAEEKKRRDLAQPLDNALYENSVLKDKLERREELIRSMRKYINVDILGVLMEAENSLDKKNNNNTNSNNNNNNNIMSPIRSSNILSPTPSKNTSNNSNSNANTTTNVIATNNNNNNNILASRKVSDSSRDIIKKKVTYDNHLDDMSLLALQDEINALKVTISLKDSDINLLKKRLEKEYDIKKDLLANAERHELRIMDEVKEIQSEKSKLNLMIIQKDNAFEKLLKSNEVISQELLLAKKNINTLDNELVERIEEVSRLTLSLKNVQDEKEAMVNLLPDLNRRLDESQKQIFLLKDNNQLLSERYDRLVEELDKLVANGIYVSSNKHGGQQLGGGSKKVGTSIISSKKKPRASSLMRSKKLSRDASSDDDDDKRSVSSSKGGRLGLLNSPSNSAHIEDVDVNRRVSFFERKQAEEVLQQEKLRHNATMRANADLEHKLQEMKKKIDEEMIIIQTKEDELKNKELDTRNTIMDLRQQKEESDSKVRSLKLEIHALKNIKRERAKNAVKSVQTIIKGNTIYELSDETINDQSTGAKGVSGAWKSLVKAELAVFQPSGGGHPSSSDDCLSGQIGLGALDENSDITTTSDTKSEKTKMRRKTKKLNRRKSTRAKEGGRVTAVNAKRKKHSNDGDESDSDSDGSDSGLDNDDEGSDDDSSNTKRGKRKLPTVTLQHVETQTEKDDNSSPLEVCSNTNSKTNKRTTLKREAPSLSYLKPVIDHLASISTTFLMKSGIGNVDLNANTNSNASANSYASGSTNPVLAIDYMNMISCHNSNHTNTNNNPHTNTNNSAGNIKWTTKLLLHQSDLCQVMEYIMTIISTRNDMISTSPSSPLLSVLDPILESLLYLLTRRLKKLNYSGYKDNRDDDENGHESDDLYEIIEDDDITSSTFKYTSVKKPLGGDVGASIDQDAPNPNSPQVRHYLNMSDVQRKLPSNVDFLLQYAQAELQMRMESESIELKGGGGDADDLDPHSKHTNTISNLNNPVFSRLAGPHWALSEDLIEIRAKWENMKIKHSSSGSPIVIEDTMQSRGPGVGSRPNPNPSSAPPPNSPPNSAKQRIRRGRTISSTGNRGGGSSMSPPARSISPCKDDNNDLLDGLEAYGFSLEAAKEGFGFGNRDLKSRGGSRGASSRPTSSRGASSRPTSKREDCHQRSLSANATKNNGSRISTLQTSNNIGNDGSDGNTSTTFKLRPLTAPKSVMFHGDIDDDSSTLSAGIMRVEVGYQPKHESNSNGNSLILIGQPHHHHHHIRK